MGDHTESFQVDFDSGAISYEELLDLFWQSHDPTRGAWKTQYASLILAADDEQLARARESADTYARLLGKPIATRIERLDRFWLAEDYHQKYYLRNDRQLLSDFRAMYPDDQGLLDSTAAARVNGYLYGAGQCPRLERDLPDLGVSDEAAAHLRARCR